MQKRIDHCKLDNADSRVSTYPETIVQSDLRKTSISDWYTTISIHLYLTKMEPHIGGYVASLLEGI